MSTTPSKETDPHLNIVDIHSLAGFIDAHLEAIDPTGEASSFPWLEEYLFQFSEHLIEYQIVRKPEPSNPFYPAPLVDEDDAKGCE